MAGSFFIHLMYKYEFMLAKLIKCVYYINVCE